METGTHNVNGIRRVGVLGGGPAGLYAARLLKLGRPGLDVTVYERHHPSETFGFGVGLTGATQRNLSAADVDTAGDLVAAGVPIAHQEFRLPGATVPIRGGGSLGIGRAALLRVLLRHAERAGVRLEVGARAVGDIDADVVLVCDGVNSAARGELGSEIGAHVTAGRGLYLWCGTEFALPAGVFIPVSTEHGMFVAHAYPYAADRSTVLIETDEATWRRAGFDVTTAALAGDGSGASDEASLRYLEAAFADHLGDRALLGNRTRWLRFSTVTCACWHAGRTVLLGDAAHTAHYSLGSGTKLAMEDAIALARCLVSAADGRGELGEACAAYEAERRPAVARLQALAARSQSWWESFPQRAGLPSAQVALSYMTRSGNVSLDQLRRTTPELVAGALGDFAGGAIDSPAPVDPEVWTLAHPFAWRGVRFPDRVLNGSPPPGYREVAPATPEHVQAARLHRVADGEVIVATLPVRVDDPWGPGADDVVGAVRALLSAGADGVRLTGPPDRSAVLDRLALAERLRLETDGLVVVDGAADVRSDLAAGLASGRTHLVTVSSAAAHRPGRRYRIGLVVPSSNVTVETEMPALLARHSSAGFSFHASRMTMREVSADQLATMNAQADRCVDELADAGVDAVLYGCLVAVMAEGARPAGAAESEAAHRRIEGRVGRRLAERGLPAAVASSAGALLEALHWLGARNVALVTPYVRPLAETVVAYLEAEGIAVGDWRALEVADNAAVGRIPGEDVMAAARSLDLTGVDALVLSACVQMPSLDLIQPAEEEFGLPVLSAATAGASVLLRRLGLEPVLPGAGSLLAPPRIGPARPLLTQEAR